MILFRFARFGDFVLAVSLVSFQWFRFVVSGFSTCPLQRRSLYHLILRTEFQLFVLSWVPVLCAQSLVTCKLSALRRRVFRWAVARMFQNLSCELDQEDLDKYNFTQSVYCRDIEYQAGLPSVGVEGRLYNCRSFWPSTLSSPLSVQNIVTFGYALP